MVGSWRRSNWPAANGRDCRRYIVEGVERAYLTVANRALRGERTTTAKARLNKPLLRRVRWYEIADFIPALAFLKNCTVIYFKNRPSACIIALESRYRRKDKEKKKQKSHKEDKL